MKTRRRIWKLMEIDQAKDSEILRFLSATSANGLRQLKSQKMFASGGMNAILCRGKVHQ